MRWGNQVEHFIGDNFDRRIGNSDACRFYADGGAVALNDYAGRYVKSPTVYGQARAMLIAKKIG